MTRRFVWLCTSKYYKSTHIQWQYIELIFSIYHFLCFYFLYEITVTGGGTPYFGGNGQPVYGTNGLGGGEDYPEYGSSGTTAANGGGFGMFQCGVHKQKYEIFGNWFKSYN